MNAVPPKTTAKRTMKPLFLPTQLNPNVSRFMKKLFEDGFVGRDTSIRPYRYTITEKGRERIGSDEGGIVYAVSQ